MRGLSKDCARNQQVHNEERIGIEPALNRESTGTRSGLFGDSSYRRTTRSVQGRSQDSARSQ
eukprot:2979079-Alexandrium_andersonii.AAC.1